MGSRRRAKGCIDTMPKAVMTCPYVSPLISLSILHLPLSLHSFHLLSHSIYPSFLSPRFLPPPILTNIPTQAHIKSSLIGASVSVPITDGNLALGTWQGIWFLEFRNGKQRRKVLATVQGVKM